MLINIEPILKKNKWKELKEQPNINYLSTTKPVTKQLIMPETVFGEFLLFAYRLDAIDPNEDENIFSSK